MQLPNTIRVTQDAYTGKCVLTETERADRMQAFVHKGIALADAVRRKRGPEIIQAMAIRLLDEWKKDTQ